METQGHLQTGFQAHAVGSGSQHFEERSLAEQGGKNVEAFASNGFSRCRFYEEEEEDEEARPGAEAGDVRPGPTEERAKAPQVFGPREEAEFINGTTQKQTGVNNDNTETSNVDLLKLFGVTTDIKSSGNEAPAFTLSFAADSSDEGD